jgi:hypothetical protein
MKVVNQVFETTDYSIFKELEGNRDLNELHVARLKKSFSESYLFTPLLVNKNMQVIDGNHRKKAAQALGLPIRYIILNGYGLREVQIYNTNMKNWKKEDYLKGYCDMAYPEYLKFRNFMRKYPDFGISSSEAILSYSTELSGIKKDTSVDFRYNSGNAPLGKIFEEGKFQIPDYEKSCSVADQILLLKPYYDGFNRRLFVTTIISLLKNTDINIPELVQKLKYQPNAIQHCTNVVQYKLMLEDIYNYKRRDKISLRY